MNKKKEEITRKDLKKDFLKQSIIRIDYDYMFDEYIEETMKKIDDFLGDKGYTIKNNFMSKFGLKVDIDKLNDDVNTNIMDTINVESDKREKFFSFVNENKNIRIDITREYSAITVEYVEHIHFDEIYDIFNEIVKELRNARRNLQIKRLGLRKINIFMMKDISKINNFFEENTFNYSDKNLSSYQFIGKNSLVNYKCGDYLVNQIANIAQGYLQTDDSSQLLYQLVLDFDIYIENLTNQEILKDMNDKLFEIYKNSLTESFLNELLIENFNNEEIFKL